MPDTMQSRSWRLAGSGASRSGAPSGPPPHPDMVWIPGGTFDMGSRRSLSGGGARSHKVSRRRLLDRSLRRSPTRSSAASSSHRPRHLRARSRPTPAELPAALPAHAASRPRWCSSARASGASTSGHFGNWWTLHARRRLGHPTGPQARARHGARRPSGGARHLQRRRGLAQMGGQGTADRGRVGVRRAAAGSTAPSTRGAASSRRGGRHMANTWQGEFPWQRSPQSTATSARRPWSGAPARTATASHDMIGNVSGSGRADWYAARHPRSTPCKACCIPSEPARRPRGRTATTRASRPSSIPRKVLKGGSHLCAPNYCRRYRPAARFAGAGRYVRPATSDSGAWCE